MRLLQIPKKSNKPPGSQVKTGRPSKNMCKPCKGWGSLWTVLTKIYYYYGDGSEQAREEQDVLVSEKCIVAKVQASKMAGCGLIHHPSWVSNDCFIVQ